MLDTIGVDSIDALFRGVPSSAGGLAKLDIPNGISEPELLADLESLSSKNRTCVDSDLICFLGGGVYDHFCPTVVEHLSTQSEFLTAYTPYQAEAAQGTLQAFYEFQTMICQLTGMDVANASLYEQASAVAEAVFMATAVTKRNRVLVSSVIHPDSLRVLQTLSYEQDHEFVKVPVVGGVTDGDALASAIDGRTAAIVVQSPNYLGVIEHVTDMARLAHDAGALLIQVFDPMSCGLLKRPGEMGVDIAVGEGQPLGIPMAYGGPFLGLLACREAFLRKMPGRVVGATLDAEGKRGFCLTLQAREQHIKRERATSNICTNQGLLAMRAAVYMAAMGRNGLRQAAQLCLDKAHYAAKCIDELDGFDLRFAGPFFREFVIRSRKPVTEVLRHCRQRNILAGVDLGRWFDDLDDCFMVAVTEKRTRKQIDALVGALAAV